MSLGLSNNNQETIEDEGRSSRNVLGRTDRQAGNTQPRTGMREHEQSVIRSGNLWNILGR